MQARLKVGSDSKPRLLVAKGCFDPMGGAERDIIRVIPSLMERFEVSVATLRPSKEVQSLCSDLGLRLLTPAGRGHCPQGSSTKFFITNKEDPSKLGRPFRG